MGAGGERRPAGQAGAAAGLPAGKGPAARPGRTH